MHEYVRRRRQNVRDGIRDVRRGEHPARVASRRKLCGDRARVDDGDFYAGVTHLEHQVFREPHDRVFGRRVTGSADERAAARDRSDDDDVSRPSRQHAGEHGARHIEQRVEIHVDHSPPLLARQLEKRLHIANAGVVDEHLRVDAC